jgi:hypothetical protein
LTPVLVGVTVLILGRAHYILYVRKQGNRFSKITTWVTTLFVVGFWAWQWGVAGWWTVSSGIGGSSG